MTTDERTYWTVTGKGLTRDGREVDICVDQWMGRDWGPVLQFNMGVNPWKFLNKEEAESHAARPNYAYGYESVVKDSIKVRGYRETVTTVTTLTEI